VLILSLPGITRDSRHKRRLTGGRRNVHQKKRKYEMGRQPAMTKMGAKRISAVRGRGGNMKFRALRLDSGSFSWGTQNCTRKARVLDVVYNSSNNELVRTKTLVKNAIIQVDATPFRQWFEQYHGAVMSKKNKASPVEKADLSGKSSSVASKLAGRFADAQKHLDARLVDQMNSGRLYACISSRPGQSGRCDGYILEGEELGFYVRKLQKKKGKK
jgi:small subunit ribosomal protein S8e